MTSAVMNGAIQALADFEVDLVDGGSQTATALRDFAAAAAIVGGVAAVAGAEPVAIGAGLAAGCALLAAAIIG